MRRMTINLLLLTLLAIGYLPTESQALVHLKKFYNLTREEFFTLDRDVTNFYQERHWELDTKKPDYDMLLHRAIRAYKHTAVTNHFEYIYGAQETMDQARGKQVNDSLCLEQLEALHAVLEHSKSESITQAPISMIHFLESWARAEPGVLSGSTVWFGSVPGCVRARIPAGTLQEASGNKTITQQEIRGRYCVGHVKAKNWPENDLWYEDRISLKSGLCLPASCHSKFIMEQERAREIINYMFRHVMVDPFNLPHRYKVTYVYCAPDEDSPLRQLSLGAKLFYAFAGIWLAIIIYASWLYERRQRAAMKLASPPSSATPPSTTDDEFEAAGSQKSIKALNLAVADRDSDTPRPSPLASDADELTETLKEFVKASSTGKRAYTHRRSSRQAADSASLSEAKKSVDGDLDLYSALSIQSNLSNLLRERAPRTQKQEAKMPKASTQSLQKKLSRRLSPQSRRLSSSTSDLLNKEQLSAIDEKPSLKRPAKVNVDIVDGLKAILTNYIVLGHVSYVLIEFERDTKYLQERMTDLVMTVVLNGSQAVSLFYIITGFLLTYLTFTKSNSKQINSPGFWLFVIINRYLRLMPVYALVFWFAKHVGPYSGSGAYWLDYRTDVNNVRGYCSIDSWWSILTLSSADTKQPYGCMPQTWYLSCDFRSMLVLPIYLVVLAKNQTAGYLAIFATMIYSYWSYWQALVTAPFDFREVMRFGPHMTSASSDRLNQLYMQNSIRISTYLSGVLLGHWLYLYEIGKIEEIPRWAKKYGFPVSITALICAFCTIIICKKLSFLFPPVEEADVRSVFSLILFVKGVLEISLVIILGLTATGHAWNWVTKILTSRMMKILANISYAVFCVHYEMIFKIPAIRLDHHYFYHGVYFLFVNVNSFFTGFLIHLLYEMPVNNLLRSYQKKVYKMIQGK